MTAKRHWLAALLLLASCAQRPERVVEADRFDGPAPRGEALLRNTMIGAHNAARAAAGVAPVTWDETLVVSAKGYAQTMAQTGRFEHAGQSQGPRREGENLWTGTRDAYAYDEMIGHWVAEKRDFTNGPAPAFSRTGRWQDVAHYTQIVWRGSTRVGCATASNTRDDYLVRRYAPAGNVVGQRAF